MKYTVEIILLIVLVALMYYKDNLLTDMSKTQLGKLFLILLVVLLFITCNVNCAILGALVVIVIMHNSMSEGMENEEDKEQEKADAAADIAAELTGGDEETAEEKEDETTGLEDEEEEEEADAAGAPIEDDLDIEEPFGVRENYESYTPRDLERVLHLSGESATLNSTAENL